MKVSVCLITYNHETFIAQAVDSILMQGTDFDYELIVGEDDSDDRTRDIVVSYRERFPQKIRLLLNDRSSVIYYRGKPTGRWNFANTFLQAKGQYVALLDGDDYWIDPGKLQVQADYLDQHPDCVACFHDIKEVFSEDNRQPLIHRPPGRKETYRLADVLRNHFMPTCSVMVRRGVVDDFPDWFYEVSVGDWPFMILHAQRGKIGYLNKTMAVHRVHSGGVWGGTTREEQIMGLMDLAQVIDAHLGFRYTRTINAAISRQYFLLAAHFADCGRRTEARGSLRKSISRRPLNPRIKWLDMATLVTRLYLPAVHRLLRQLRLMLSSTGGSYESGANEH